MPDTLVIRFRITNSRQRYLDGGFGPYRTDNIRLMDTSLVIRRAELEQRDYELRKVINDGRVGFKLVALPGSFKPKKVAESRLLYRYDAATKQGTPLSYTREQH
jgi:hypothetical protein